MSLHILRILEAESGFFLFPLDKCLPSDSEKSFDLLVDFRIYRISGCSPSFHMDACFVADVGNFGVRLFGGMHEDGGDQSGESVEDIVARSLSGTAFGIGGGVAVDCIFDCIQVEATEFIDAKVVDGTHGLEVVVLLEVGLDLLDEFVACLHDPLVNEAGCLGIGGVEIGEVGEEESQAVANGSVIFSSDFEEFFAAGDIVAVVD